MEVQWHYYGVIYTRNKILNDQSVCYTECKLRQVAATFLAASAWPNRWISSYWLKRLKNSVGNQSNFFNRTINDRHSSKTTWLVNILQDYSPGRLIPTSRRRRYWCAEWRNGYCSVINIFFFVLYHACTFSLIHTNCLLTLQKKSLQLPEVLPMS